MYIDSPKGFFPIQDTGLISGVSEAAQEVSPHEMMRLQQELGEIILRDPDVQAIGSQTGSTDSPNPANTGGFTIVLKPREQRTATARQIIDRLRPQFAQVPGANVFLQPTQDINVGARIGRGSYQYTLQDANIDELIEWSQKMLEKMRTLPQLADATERSPRQCAAAQDHHQPRPGLALRHLAAADRRHAQRRLRAAPDHPVSTPSSTPIS